MTNKIKKLLIWYYLDVLVNIQFATSSIRLSKLFFLISHSHITIIFHFKSTSCSILFLSLLIFDDILFSQNSIFDFGRWESLQLEWACQKQPCTNITVLYLGSTISGFRKHSKKCTFYTLRFGCSFAAVNTIKPQLLWTDKNLKN